MTNERSDGQLDCTTIPLLVAADSVGLLGMLLLVVSPVVALVECFRHGFGSFGVLLITGLMSAFSQATMARILLTIPGKLAVRRGFEFDPETRIATWVENGEPRRFP